MYVTFALIHICINTISFAEVPAGARALSFSFSQPPYDTKRPPRRSEVSTGVQILLTFKAVFLTRMSVIKFESHSLKWAHFGTIADLDWYIHQSSCFGLR